MFPKQELDTTIVEAKQHLLYSFNPIAHAQPSLAPI